MVFLDKGEIRISLVFSVVNQIILRTAGESASDDALVCLELGKFLTSDRQEKKAGQQDESQFVTEIGNHFDTDSYKIKIKMLNLHQ